MLGRHQMLYIFKRDQFASSMKSIMRSLLIAVVFLFGSSHAWAEESLLRFSVPISCDPTSECLVQQYPDMAAGPEAVDPFCGHATYDTHDGVDIRVPSLADTQKGVPVLAMADGRVLRMRDDVPDRLVETAEDRALIAGKECGNGLVVDHGNGWSVQYCHLRQGAIVVRPGQTVKRGERLGLVGASGLAQFPHVHVTVRRNASTIDPMTGHLVGSGCMAKPSYPETLWTDDAFAWLAKAERHIIGAGLTGTPVAYDDLVHKGFPQEVRAGDAAILGWGWFANLETGDRIHIRIEASNGRTLIDQTGDALTNPRAVHFQIAGRRRSVTGRTYPWTIEVLRNHAVLTSISGVETVQ